MAEIDPHHLLLSRDGSGYEVVYREMGGRGERVRNDKVRAGRWEGGGVCFGVASWEREMVSQKGHCDYC